MRGYLSKNGARCPASSKRGIVTYNRGEWIDHCDNMKNGKDNQAIHAGEQTPEVLSRNLKILGKDVIEFSVKNMVIAQSGVIKKWVFLLYLMSIKMP